MPTKTSDDALVLPMSRMTAIAPKAPYCSGPRIRAMTSICSIAMTWDSIMPTPTMAVPRTETPCGADACPTAGVSVGSAGMCS